MGIRSAASLASRATRSVAAAIIAAAFAAAVEPSRAGPAEEAWLDRFAYRAFESNPAGVREGTIGSLPEIRLSPDREPGPVFVRLSVPFAPGAFPDGLALVARAGNATVRADTRVLSLHPGKPASVRRALVTFVLDAGTDWPAPAKVSLELEDRPSLPPPEALPAPEGRVELEWRGQRLRMGSDFVEVSGEGTPPIRLRLVAPPAAAPVCRGEVVERGDHFLWVRLLCADPAWPRFLDARLDAAGGFVVDAAVQRRGEGDATAPDLGWVVEGLAFRPFETHRFADGASIAIAAEDGTRVATFPRASGERRGRVEAIDDAGGRAIRFLRCEEAEGVPFQSAAWRRAAIAIDPAREGRPIRARNALLEYEAKASIDPAAFAEAYDGSGEAPDLSAWPVLAALDRATRDAIVASVAQGDDFGNATSFTHGRESGSVHGMNRLNHNPEIFDAWRRSGDGRLRETATLWCANMHDLSVWWGEDDGFGGTRYNNAVAAGRPEHEGDANFMWRTNGDSNFCTKGYDSFFLAWEETGDPTHLAALRAQLGYAAEHVHTDRGEARNIGDVADFATLHRLTGRADMLDEATRLFRQLRGKLSDGDLFSQGGEPIVPDPPFIDNDADGYKHPFAKPYIIGYALAGLPDLLRALPEEPKLREVVRAVADFLAETVDPAGGWRYPHPRSSNTLVSQGIEHAMQICRAAEALEERGEPVENLVDAVETVLRARVLVFAKTGRVFSGLGPWEQTAGLTGEGKPTLAETYARPEDRDATRDYTEGAIGLGWAPPEGLVYLNRVLDFYLRRRPAERLFSPGPELKTILDRIAAPPPEEWIPPSPERAPESSFGVRTFLPSFSERRVARMTFPLAWSESVEDFDAWRTEAREALLAALLDPPPRADFSPETLAVEDRGTHEARRIEFAVSADCRIPAYLLTPKGARPGAGLPAILALHDHGAHFSIGKEKVVRPFAEETERLADAGDWTGRYYGGRWIGDELAARGYVVLAADALFWGDRGREGGPKYEDQQALGANMLQLGQSWAGTILWDDIRSAEYLRSLPEVDPARVGAIGLSMGGFRTWNLAAATDAVAAGAAICWLGDTPTLMAEGNNQTKGQSAFSMIQPGIRNLLDYPDVASIACPKPMLFFNGTEDALFPVAGVEASYERMRRVWRARGADHLLETRLWPVPHLFDVEMQEAAFAWLDARLKR